jgi:hypothetical protein
MIGRLVQILTKLALHLVQCSVVVKQMRWLVELSTS